MNQESLWSSRYRDAGEQYLFGTEPNRFLAHRLGLLQNGRTALSVADGEGRNSVWLAEQGLDVTAIEISPVAIEKARRLAAGRQVDVRFLLADMLGPEWPPAEFHNTFDWVIGVFIQSAWWRESPERPIAGEFPVAGQDDRPPEIQRNANSGKHLQGFIATHTPLETLPGLLGFRWGSTLLPSFSPTLRQQLRQRPHCRDRLCLQVRWIIRPR